MTDGVSAMFERLEEERQAKMAADRKIVCNRIITPDGTVLISHHRHDYKEYKDKNGHTYMVDGGNSYLRRIVNDQAPYREASVYSDDPHENIRQGMHWGSYGKDGDQPLRWIRLDQMSDAHINAILYTQPHIRNTHIEKILLDEEQYRKDNGILIED